VVPVIIRFTSMWDFTHVAQSIFEESLFRARTERQNSKKNSAVSRQVLVYVLKYVLKKQDQHKRSTIRLS